jgi:ABC-type sugar transport system substrate-binding protein
MGPSASPADPFRPAWPIPSPDQDFVPIGPWNTDGILVANPLHTEARSDYIQGLVEDGHPVLFIGAGEKGPTIMADNAGGIMEAMHHLVYHGHKQIAFIAGSHEDMNGDSGDRLSAYRSFLDLNNLEIDLRRIAFGRHVYDGGYAAMKEILGSGTTFTAVLASNDESALGAMQALKEAGRKIPQDVAVIGFDNRFEGAAHEPGLSSIHVPLFNMGYQALKRLIEHLEAKTGLGGTNKVETRLVTRASCGCGTGSNFPLLNETPPHVRMVKAMASIILSQAHSLTNDECQMFCRQLADAFVVSVQRADGSKFQDALMDVLKKTTAAGDDAHIWQDAVPLLATGAREDSTSIIVIHELLNTAQLTIGRQCCMSDGHPPN